jgi:hypothetical protein
MDFGIRFADGKRGNRDVSGIRFLRRGSYNAPNKYIEKFGPQGPNFSRAGIDMGSTISLVAVFIGWKLPAVR